MTTGGVGSSDWLMKLPYGKIVVTTSGGAYGVNQMRRNITSTRHERMVRQLDRGKGLTEGSINPSQYVLYCSLDNVPKEHIKAGLVAWGKESGGCNFSNSEAFGVEDADIVSADGWKRVFRVQDKSCRLNVYKSEGEEKLLGHSKYFARRGGYTETTEVQEMARSNTEMAAANYKSRPNLFCETSEEYVQGVPDREILYTYSCPRPNTVPAALYYVAGISLALIVTFSFEYFQRQFSRKKSPKGSQTSDSTLEENSPITKFKRPSSITLMTGDDVTEQCEGQGLKVEEKSSTGATPDFMLKVFICCKNGKITKKAATRLLMTYYNFSELEASEWLV